MNRIILLLILLSMPLVASEIWLGVVDGMKGDTLILVDGLNLYIPGLSNGKFLYDNNIPLDLSAITFPLKASLVVDDRYNDVTNILTEEGVRAEFSHLVYVKVHKFCELKDGRLIDK